MKEAFESTLGTGRVVLYDHWGSCESENLIAQIRYMAKAAGCTHIFLDHLSIVVSGLADGDERRIIDNTMTKLRSLVEETGVAMFLVSHLKRPEGRGHEEGAQTSLSHLRGSHAISQLSDAVIGLERDQQDRESANFTTMRVLKNRYTGDTGVACRLEYDKKTGRLSETTLPDEFDFGGDE
jgi:twinkle protein